MSNQFIQVTTTADSADEARRIARTLVEQRLAACVQIVGPIESLYRWEGRAETATEWQCVIKTSLARYTEVQQAILEMHSYDVPEIIAVSISDGSEAYLRWLKDSIE